MLLNSWWVLPYIWEMGTYKELSSNESLEGPELGNIPVHLCHETKCRWQFKSICISVHRVVLQDFPKGNSGWNLHWSRSSLVLMSAAEQETTQAWMGICILMLTQNTSQCQQKRRRNVLEVMHLSILGGWQLAGWDSST